MTNYTNLGNLISPAPIVRCGDGAYPVLSMTMHDGIVLQSERFKKSLASSDQSEYKVVKYGQLVVGFPIDEGVLYIQKAAAEGIMSPAYNVWNVDTMQIDPDFLELCLHSPQSMQYYRSKLRGTTARRRSIHTADLLALPIRLPDMEVQKAAVALAQKMEKVITLRKEQLNHMDQLVKSRFIELFGDGCDERFPQKSLPQIIIKDKHALKRGPFGGALKKDDFVESGYLVYEQRHAIHNDFAYEKYYISPTKYREMIAFKVEPGDLIISCSGVTLGRIAEIPANAKKGIINQALLKVSLDQSIMTNTFFVHQFRSERIQDILFGFCRGSGIPNFPSMNEVKAVQFICPPIELQQQFVAFVEQTDKSKLAVQKSLEELEILKKSLMQQYFG